MIDVILLIGRLLFVAILYLFLFALVKTGIGMVRGTNAKGKKWTLNVETGPKELRGVKIAVTGPVIVGRSSGADIVVAATYVSGRHAQFKLIGQNLFVEDLGSTNGTAVNGNIISNPTALKNNDVVNIGDVSIRVKRK